MQRWLVATASRVWAAVSLIQCWAELQSPDILQRRGRAKHLPWHQLATMSTLITSHNWHSEHLGSIITQTKTNGLNTRCRRFLPFCGSSRADPQGRCCVHASFSIHLVELLTGLQVFGQGTLFNSFVIVNLITVWCYTSMYIQWPWIFALATTDWTYHFTCLRHHRWLRLAGQG